ncbi:MAG: PHP domain-containing protein [Dehalococcoidia bacterium]|nr:PHP domain-containing protein [Dehalococcoidia bacterium]
MTMNEPLSKPLSSKDRIVDLHSHTSASDGILSPAELVRLAAVRGVSILAITDHDSTQGIEEAIATACSLLDLVVIPGVEIGTDIPNGEVHILGYYVNFRDQAFQSQLEMLRESRLGRARNMIAKLADMGIRIEWSRVQEIAGNGAVGRPHIAQAMFENGHINSLQEAFTKYIGRNGPAYAERFKLTPTGAVQLITSVGGLPVIAHPADIRGLEALVKKLKPAGLVGIEAYYDGYPPEVVGNMVKLANKYDLIPCGGSDFHGRTPEEESDLGSTRVPPESAQRLLALAQQHLCGR